MSLSTGTGFSPRFVPDYLLYVSATGLSESIWKVENGTATELWTGQGVRIFGGPAISRDGRHIAFSVRQDGQSRLYTMQADGTNVRVESNSLEFQGGPHGRPTANRLPLRPTIMASPICFASQSTLTPQLLWSGSTPLIPHGRRTAASLFIRDPTSAPRFR